MELQLPQLQGLSRGHLARPRAHPVFDRRGRRRLLGAGQRIAGHPGATAGESRSAAGARAIRDSAIAAIVLVDGQVDHTTGLYMLRESVRPWPIWCTDSTFADLTRGNPVFGVLGHFCGVDRRRIDLDDAGFSVDGVPGVRWRALPVASKPAPYSPNRDSPIAGDNLALVIEDEGSGTDGGVCAGLERHRRCACGAPCNRPPVCWWTARFGPTMR